MLIIGIDEVGRGCWAGPLVAGAVILHKHIDGLKDSKKLSARQRKKLAIQIRENAVAIGLGWVWPAQIDKHGITWSVRNAMQFALEQVSQLHAIDDMEVIVDGNYNYLADYSNSKAVIKADDTVPEVSAASIIAKVARDEYMATMSLIYPSYGFEKNVGYGTRHHQSALRQHGVLAIHRKSYKPIIAVMK